MKRYGLIGHPLGHSFSKAYFTEKFKQAKIDACYDNYDIESIEQLPLLLKQHPDLCGFNVTIPHKEAILTYLDSLDTEAEAVGAVNTVVVTADGRLKGFNTDVSGFNSEFRIPNSALILGTGGASKAVQYMLKHRGLPYHLVSRTQGKGHFTYDELNVEIIQEHLIIINTTPVGMSPHIEEAPRIPYEALTPQHTLFDLIYNPEDTLFLRHGREHGAHTINGLTMLHAQAEASWNIWNKESK